MRIDTIEKNHSINQYMMSYVISSYNFIEFLFLSSASKNDGFRWLQRGFWIPGIKKSVVQLQSCGFVDLLVVVAVERPVAWGEVQNRQECLEIPALPGPAFDLGWTFDSDLWKMPGVTCSLASPILNENWGESFLERLPSKKKTALWRALWIDSHFFRRMLHVWSKVKEYLILTAFRNPWGKYRRVADTNRGVFWLPRCITTRCGGTLFLLLHRNSWSVFWPLEKFVSGALDSSLFSPENGAKFYSFGGARGLGYLPLNDLTTYSIMCFWYPHEKLRWNWWNVSVLPIGSYRCQPHCFSLFSFASQSFCRDLFRFKLVLFISFTENRLKNSKKDWCKFQTVPKFQFKNMQKFEKKSERNNCNKNLPQKVF